MANVHTDKAYKYIRKRILTGEYPLGSPLKPHRLTTEIGVSRTPIRDALRLLETDGLVVMKPRLGARVVSLTIEEFAHLCAMRLALESYAAGLAAANRTESQLQELTAAFRSFADTGHKLIADPGNVDLDNEYQRLDLQFHIVLLTAARNPLIKNECTRIHLLDHLLSSKFIRSAVPAERAKDDTATMMREHEAILQAVEKQDAAAARTAMERHLQPVVDSSIAALRHEANYHQTVLRKIQMIESTVQA
ncbi:MAG: GntR family transcriptional regulator [Opitutaceae bacterium]